MYLAASTNGTTVTITKLPSRGDKAANNRVRRLTTAGSYFRRKRSFVLNSEGPRYTASLGAGFSVLEATEARRCGMRLQVVSKKSEKTKGEDSIIL